MDKEKLKNRKRLHKMKRYNLKIWDGNKFICINNCYLLEFKPKIPKLNLCEIPSPMEDIEITLRFKAPYFDKNGKENYFMQPSKKKLKQSKNIILK